MLSSNTSEAGRMKLLTPSWRPQVIRRSSESLSLAEVSEEAPAMIRDCTREAGSEDSHCDTLGSWGPGS